MHTMDEGDKRWKNYRTPIAVKNDNYHDVNEHKPIRNRKVIREDKTSKSGRVKKPYTDLTAICLKYMCGHLNVNTLRYVWCVNEHECF